MTQDYAKKPKAKPVARKKTSTKVEKPLVAGWVWLLTGIVLGVFVSFLASLVGITPSPNSDLNTALSTTVDKASESISRTKFDFYTLLPEQEIIVPVDSAQSNRPVAPASVYILQAGSFKRAADADRLRAKLILMGMDARIESVRSSNGELWHRVQVGPFKDRSKLAKARSTLINQGIDTLLLKRKA